ncbi:hypothetical protein [Cedecea neteri]|uniref:hypothetical protein n=1 Tax=Cedecea neteri TaxID=158822 RepID=UPI000ADBF0BF|nr:hypothetical protein [Cedecea neteri]
MLHLFSLCLQSAKSLTRALANARCQRDLHVRIRPIRPDDNLAIADVIRKTFRDNKIDHIEGVSLHDPALAIEQAEAFGFQHLDGSLGNTGHNSCDICMLKTLK